jgi:hypothetical protein
MTRAVSVFICFFLLYAAAAQAACLYNDHKDHEFPGGNGGHATSQDSGSHDHSDADVHCFHLSFQSAVPSRASLAASLPFAGNLRVLKSLGTIWQAETTAADLWLRSLFWRALSLQPSIGVSRHIFLSVLRI